MLLSCRPGLSVCMLQVQWFVRMENIAKEHPKFQKRFIIRTFEAEILKIFKNIQHVKPQLKVKKLDVFIKNKKML